MQKLLLILSFFISSKMLHAQVAGNTSYTFLNQSLSARQNALGGNFLSRVDHDIDLAIYNPSILDSSYHKNISFSFNDYLSDVKLTSLSYGHQFKKAGVFSFAMNYQSYGELEKTDVSGNKLGSFSANDFWFNVGYGKMLKDSLFSLGANLKVVYSQYDSYQSAAAALDLAGTYHLNKADFHASLIARNIGFQFFKYNQVKDTLPFEMHLAFTKGLNQAPFSFTVVYENLQQFKLAQLDPNAPIEKDPFTNEIIVQKEYSFFDQLLRHFIISTEVKIKEVVFVRLGYNFRRQFELAQENSKGASGLTFGIGTKINQFNFSYGLSTYAKGALANSLTLGVELDKFYRRSTNINSSSNNGEKQKKNKPPKSKEDKKQEKQRKKEERIKKYNEKYQN